jgi:hypothetical protein
MQYELISMRDPVKFTHKVNEMLSLGWQLYGPTFANQYLYVQAFTYQKEKK